MSVYGEKGQLRENIFQECLYEKEESTWPVVSLEEQAGLCEGELGGGWEQLDMIWVKEEGVDGNLGVENSDGNESKTCCSSYIPLCL